MKTWVWAIHWFWNVAFEILFSFFNLQFKTGLVENHWSKWIIKWVILHIEWVTRTQVVAQSKSFESAWGRKLKNTVRENNVGWYQFTQVWFIHVSPPRATRTVTVRPLPRVRTRTQKWTWKRYFLLSLNTIFIIFAGGLFGAAIWSELFYRNYFDVVDGQPVLVFLFRNIFESMLFYLNFRFWLGESINQSESCRKSLQARPVLFSLFHFSDGQALINIILDFWNFIFHFALLYLLHNYFSAFSPSHIQHKYFLISPMPCTQHSTVWLIYFFIHIKGLDSNR